MEVSVVVDLKICVEQVDRLLGGTGRFFAG